MSAAPVIPYEKQSDSESTRTCGAACLSMVYRSFGKEVPQSEIWPNISRQNRFGSLASTTHLMARDALARGFTALAFQARHPLQVLRLCRDHGARAILNHRLKSDSEAGHYSVLVDLDDKGVVLHDPFFGPSRRFTHEELMALWRPVSANSEIAGHALIAIAEEPKPLAPCVFCHTAAPPAVSCPQCRKPVGLDPGVVLGCINKDCIARMWNYICCPSCDFTWTFALQSGQDQVSAAPGAGAAAADEAPAFESALNVDRIFGALDNFCAHIMSLPGAATRPEIKSHVDFLLASKDRLKLAQAEQEAGLKLRQQQMSNAQEQAKKREEAHRQKVAEIQQPLPPLDVDALRAALLKNLGFRSD